MTDKEKEAIDNVTKILNKEIDLKIYSHTDYKIIKRAYKLYTDKDIGIILNLIQTQQKEIERLKCNNEILQGELDRIGVKALKLEKGSSTDDVIAEIEKKEAVIDEMAKTIYDYASLEVVINCPAEYDGNYNMDLCKMNARDRNCLICIKEYFINKVEKEG